VNYVTLSPPFVSSFHINRLILFEAVGKK
jgi:hypothetical protein